MRPRTTSALGVTALALLLFPAAGLAAAPASSHASANKPTSGSQPGPDASLPAKAKAYGRYCQAQSKTHLAGRPGTPFSQCVTAMAKLATHGTGSPKTACAALSKRHLTGQKGTPYSQCVTAGAKLLKTQHPQTG